MLKLLLIPLFIYLAIVLLLWAFQTRILFPAGLVGPGGPLPPRTQRLVLATPDGHRLHGVHIPPAGEGRKAGPVLLGFGGNAWNAEAMALYLHGLYPRADVTAFHYRGYAPSGGAPGADAMVADAPLVHDLVAKKFPGRPVVAIGFSVGSGVAASLAGRRGLAGLILVTPFDSLERMAADHYPWLPVRWLLRHRMPVAGWLKHASVPVALVAAERDTIVAARRTAALRASVPNLVFDRTVPGAGHNDIYQHPAFRQAMQEALAKMGP
jgi:uncharacterized protein